MIDLRSARSWSLGERAELFNAAYADYVVPFRIDGAQVAFMDEAYDIDLDASLVAFADGEPAGLANLGLRGEDGWVGGVGVVPAARRRGLGRTLMEALHEQARARGVRRMWLEVIVENTGAFALYEQLGYRVVRELEAWSLAAADEPSRAREAPLGAACARVHKLSRGREPWQRADATLAHYADARGLVTERGAAVFRVGTAVQLVQIAGDDDAELLRALRTQGDVSVLNLPPDDPAADALRALGAEIRVRQQELVLEL